jgi:hypothetical protein
MRIAVSGTHVTGKTSLMHALCASLPQHTIVPEPYDILEERARWQRPVANAHRVADREPRGGRISRLATVGGRTTTGESPD